jgi:hypothetical protein
MPRHEILRTGRGEVVRVANHAVDSPATDNNDTSVAKGPAQTTVTLATKITIDLNGYSVDILTLKP